MPRGKLKNYKIGNRSYSTTQLLDFAGVREVVSSRTTEGSKRELLRDLLRKNVIVPSMLTNRGATGPSNYGAQRARAGEPIRTTAGVETEGPRRFHDPFFKGCYDPNSPPPMDRRYGGMKKGPLRNSKGQVVEGPRKGRNPRSRGAMHFLGVRRSARDAFHFFPRLRRQVDGGKGLKQRTIEAKIQQAYKKGIDQSLLVRHEARFDRITMLRGRGEGVVKHYLLENPDRTTLLETYLEETAPEVIHLMDEHPNHKVRYVLKIHLRNLGNE